MTAENVMRNLTVLVVGLLVAVAQPAVAGEAPSGLEGLLGAKSVTEWTEYTVDSTRDVGSYLDVAVFNGVPYISYYDQAADDLWFARLVGSGGNCGPASSWRCQLVSATGDAGRHNSIAVQAEGSAVRVIIPYQQDGLSLHYASGLCDSNGCSFDTDSIHSSTVGDFIGQYTSVAFDADGLPRISYQRVASSGAVWVATRYLYGGGNCGAGQWECEVILTSTGLGASTSIAFDGLGRSHLAFYDPAAGYPWHAVRIGTGGNCGPYNDWLCRSVHVNGLDRGTSVSVFAEADGTPHLAFGDATNEDLVYSRYVGANGNCGFSGTTSQFEWRCDVIDDDIGPVAAGHIVDIAADASGSPMIVYRDASSTLGPAVLRFAQPYAAAPAGSVANCGPFVDPFYTWVCTTLDGGGADQHEAAAVAIAADSAGVAIAYHEDDSYLYRGVLKAMLLPLVLFADGFETGNTNRWSSVQP